MGWWCWDVGVGDRLLVLGCWCWAVGDGLLVMGWWFGDWFRVFNSEWFIDPCFDALHGLVRDIVRANAFDALCWCMICLAHYCFSAWLMG